MKRLTLKVCFSILVIAATADVSPAQTYPTKAIRMIIPAGPGGTVDTIGRLIAPKLNEALKQSVVADDKPGAGTMLGSELLAKSPADGYTILMMTNSHTINAALHKKLPYDPINDFAPVALVATSPYLLIVHPSVPARTVKELIALARRHPGKLTFASAGTGSSTHLAGELFKEMAHVDMLHIPYKGGSAAQVGLAGGEADLMFTGPLAAAGLIKAKRVRAIALTSAKRSPSMPDLPTVSESGVPGYESGSWYGVVVPGRTPAAIIARLNREVTRIMRMPDVRSKVEGVGADATSSTPQQFGALIKSDIARWRKIVPTLGLRIQ